MSLAGIEFKHILVPTDFNEPANRAVAVALSLAEKLGAEVTLLHVNCIPRPTYDAAVVWPTETLALRAQSALDAEVKRAKERYARCVAKRVLHSSPVPVLIVGDDARAEPVRSRVLVAS